MAGQNGRPQVGKGTPLIEQELNDPSIWRAKENAPYRLGTGDWEGFHLHGIPLNDIINEARRWGDDLIGVKKPWLCWNVDPDWSFVQQRAVREVGWTPLVGFDPRVGPPPLVPGAILIDFNARLRFPTMWMHFPLEFLFLFVEDRLAYWHADCLIRPEKMRRYAELFEGLKTDTMAAVIPTESWRRRLQPKTRRYWEVLGCSTVGASKSQFEHGCGWWLNMAMHPSASAEDKAKRLGYHWECGVGIRYWATHYHGTLVEIPERDIAEGHFTLIGRKDYKRASPRHFKRDLSKELSLNTDLVEACGKLGLLSLLEEPREADGQEG